MSKCRPVQFVYLTVNYNSALQTERLLADLFQQDASNCALTVVVADNSSSGAELAPVRQMYANNEAVRFESMPQNPGYFGGAALAFATISEQTPPDWVIVSNSDVRLPGRDALSRIAALPSDYGVIAPSVISAKTGLDQNPFLRHRPSAFRIYLNRIIPRVRLLYWLLQTQCEVKRGVRSWLMRHSHPGNRTSQGMDPTEIYAPHGSFIIFSREYFERGGSLKPGAFLYAEELFVAETCRRLGLKAVYWPVIQVAHDEHVSTAANPAVRHFMATAADYCYKEFFAKVKA